MKDCTTRASAPRLHPDEDSNQPSSASGKQLVDAANPSATMPVAVLPIATRIGNSEASRAHQTLDTWKASEETEDIDNELADAFVSAGSAPWRFIENPFMRKALSRIPGYNPPSRKALLALVDAREKSWRKDKAASLQESVGTIAADGSTQGEGVCMRNFIFVKEPSGEPVHLFTRSLDAKNADALKTLFVEAESFARSLGARTVACTVDNNGVELKAHEEMRLDGKWIPLFGCYFHVSELAMKDRSSIEVQPRKDDPDMAWVDNCFKMVEDVSTFFRHRPQLRELMKDAFRAKYKTKKGSNTCWVPARRNSAPG